MHGTIYEFEASPPLAVPVTSARSRARGLMAGTRAPLIGIIRNPRSHRNKGHSPEFAERPEVLTRTPRTRAALRAELADFAARGTANQSHNDIVDIQPFAAKLLLPGVIKVAGEAFGLLARQVRSDLSADHMAI